MADILTYRHPELGRARRSFGVRLLAQSRFFTYSTTSNAFNNKIEFQSKSIFLSF